MADSRACEQALRDLFDESRGPRRRSSSSWRRLGPSQIERRRRLWGEWLELHGYDERAALGALLLPEGGEVA